MKEKNSDNTMITPESTEAIMALIEAVTKATPNSPDYGIKNYPLIDQVIEMLKHSTMFTPEEIKRMIF